MNTFGYSLLMLATGIGIPVMAVMNAKLAQSTGSTFLAVACLSAVALLVTLCVLLRKPPSYALLKEAPAYTFAAGFFFLFYIASITWVTPHFGISNAVFCVLLGQLIASAALDRFGLMGLPVIALSPQRIAGICLMAIGLFLAIKTGK
ncbi:MAG: hypothetical protein CMM93_08885 [Rickettsiales bacterium]|nr:hypothetical protein [Rickettsiales bacterium]|tara:strand:+ start:1430 stop:1873 length:444 start_codon:yes stop_codon:yes gene_type:complete